MNFIIWILKHNSLINVFYTLKQNKLLKINKYL